jgi:hypothetical protein
MPTDCTVACVLLVRLLCVALLAQIDTMYTSSATNYFYATTGTKKADWSNWCALRAQPKRRLSFESSGRTARILHAHVLVHSVALAARHGVKSLQRYARSAGAHCVHAPCLVGASGEEQADGDAGILASHRG